MDPFDGKVGLWSFTLERPAKRNNIRTGTVVSETIILEDVRVDAVEYRTKVVAKGGVFEKMREVMWWFHTAARYKTVAGVRVPCGKIVSGKWRFSNSEGTKCPEAGTRLLYQHDGARPHTARVNTQVFVSHGKMKGFSIEVVVQPAQSPDLNVDDLTFFNSLQSDVSLVAKENRRDLLDAIIKCWHEYPLEKNGKRLAMSLFFFPRRAGEFLETTITKDIVVFVVLVIQKTTCSRGL